MLVGSGAFLVAFGWLQPYLCFMDIFLTAQSSLTVLRLARTADPRFAGAQGSAMPFMLIPVDCDLQVVPINARKVDPLLVSDLQQILRTDQLHVRVPSTAYRTKAGCFVAHSGPRILPAGSVWQLLPNANSSSPARMPGKTRVFADGIALTAAWMSTTLAKAMKGGKVSDGSVVPRVASLVMELCGTYGRDPWRPKELGPTYNLLPIETTENAIKMAGSLPRTHGLRVAMRALKLSATGSGSPMESALFIGLAFPPKYGGLHLPTPVVNRELELNVEQRSCIEGRGLRPDLWWGGARLALEYEGFDFHASRQALRRDREKMRDYQALGITVIPVTFDDVNSVSRLQELGVRIAREIDRGQGGGRESARMRRVLANEGWSGVARGVWASLLPPLQRA